MKHSGLYSHVQVHIPADLDDIGFETETLLTQGRDPMLPSVSGSQDEQNNNEPATDNHDLKMEPELYNDVREFIENFEAESHTSSHELILAPTMTVEIIQVEKRVQWSARQQLHHVKSGGRDNTGKFVVRIKFKDLPAHKPDSRVTVQMWLQRSNSSYSHVLIDKVCSKHGGGGDNHHPIMGLRQEDRTRMTFGGSAAFYNCGSVASLAEANNEITLQLYFPCNDTCPRSSDATIEGKEAARDSEFRIQMILNDEGIITETQSFGLWIKAQIVKKTLELEQRRLPKGSVAQMAAAEKRRLSVVGDGGKKRIKSEKTNLSLDEFKQMLAANIQKKLDEGSLTQEVMKEYLGI